VRARRARRGRRERERERRGIEERPPPSHKKVSSCPVSPRRSLFSLLCSGEAVRLTCFPQLFVEKRSAGRTAGPPARKVKQERERERERERESICERMDVPRTVALIQQFLHEQGFSESLAALENERFARCPLARYGASTQLTAWNSSLKYDADAAAKGSELMTILNDWHELNIASKMDGLELAAQRNAEAGLVGCGATVASRRCAARDTLLAHGVWPFSQLTPADGRFISRFIQAHDGIHQANILTVRFSPDPSTSLTALPPCLLDGAYALP